MTNALHRACEVREVEEDKGKKASDQHRRLTADYRPADFVVIKDHTLMQRGQGNYCEAEIPSRWAIHHYSTLGTNHVRDSTSRQRHRTRWSFPFITADPFCTVSTDITVSCQPSSGREEDQRKEPHRTRSSRAANRDKPVNTNALVLDSSLGRLQVQRGSRIIRRMDTNCTSVVL